MKRLFVALSTLIISGAAFAQGYVGIAGGPTKHNFSCSGTSSCDTSDVGYKLFGGYKFTPMFAGELGYTDFGKEKAKLGSASSDIRTTSLWVGGAAFFDLAPSLTASARLGIASNKAKAAASFGGSSVSSSNTKASPYFGLGIGYEFAPQITITGGLDFTKSEASIGGISESANVRLLSIGLTFGF